MDYQLFSRSELQDKMIEEMLHNIMLADHLCNPIEQQYSQTEWEALAVVWAVERLHTYLFLVDISLFTLKVSQLS